MKKWLIFLGGVITGFVLTILIAFIYNYCNRSNDDVTYFDKPGPVVNISSVKVMQVLEDNAALVHSKDPNSYSDLYLGPIYLLVNDGDMYYYDDEIINKPKGKAFRQTGIYKYKTTSGDYKTVAIIELL